MTPEAYTLSTITALARPIAPEPVAAGQLEEAIFAKVMSKKFRKLAADEHTVAMARRAIHTAVSAGEPVTVSFLFGGNKLWRFDEAPEIDWAELFAVTYYVQWMRSIASVYPLGVRLDFYAEDVAVETLNNVPRTETEQYAKTFRAMLAWLQPHLPTGVTITYRRYGEEYATYEDYLHELEAAKALVLQRNGGQLPTLTERQKAATELNVRLRPGQADDPQCAKMLSSSIRHSKKHLLCIAILMTSRSSWPALPPTPAGLLLAAPNAHMQNSGQAWARWSGGVKHTASWF